MPIAPVLNYISNYYIVTMATYITKTIMVDMTPRPSITNINNRKEVTEARSNNVSIGNLRSNIVLREHSFNLKGGGLWVFSESNDFFSRQLVETLFFFYKNNTF